MLEKIKAVNNPLTIIALFAALAEIAGTGVLAAVDKEVQHIFVWFVMGFPVLLVGLFFLTLNFNAKVLYAPSDFKDEENFLNTLAGGARNVSLSLEEVTKQLEEAKNKILTETLEQISTVGSTEKAKLSAILDEQLINIEDRLLSIRHAAEITANVVPDFPPATSAYLQNTVLKLIRETGRTLNVNDISKAVGISRKEVLSTLYSLASAELIDVSKDGNGRVYAIPQGKAVK